MPKGKKKRITFEQAKKLYPDEWVVFSDAKIDMNVAQFIDGVVYWHGKDQQEAYQKSAEIKGPRANFYTGIIPYRKMTLSEDHAISKKAA
jgi:hypothetical protein